MNFVITTITHKSFHNGHIGILSTHKHAETWRYNNHTISLSIPSHSSTVFLSVPYLHSFVPTFILSSLIHSIIHTNFTHSLLICHSVTHTHTHDTQIHFLLCRSINFLTIKTYFKACYTQNALLSSPKLDCRDAISKHPKLWILSSRHYSFTDLGAEGCCHSLNTLFQIRMRPIQHFHQIWIVITSMKNLLIKCAFWWGPNKLCLS